MKLTKEQLADIRSDSRKVHIATLRHAVCLKLSQMGYCEERIARFINRNRTTVNHSKHKAVELLDSKDKIMIRMWSKVNSYAEK